jgi:peptidoglycan DL-endopeptidase CwlO
VNYSDQKRSMARPLIAHARKYLGVPYVWGGKTPEGFDCSGLVCWVLGELGISLPEGSQGQWASEVGMRVDPSQMQPGDVIFLDMPSSEQPAPNHVGIYTGEDRMIVAPSPGKSVEVQPLGAYWHSKIVGMKRFSS